MTTDTNHLDRKAEAGAVAPVKRTRKPADKESKKALKYRLSPEGIADNTARSHITEAEWILVVLNDNCYMQAASEDWPDVKEISLNFIRELLPFTSGKAVYDIVAHTVQLYGTEVISTHRSIPERKRLAYFISQLVAQLMKCPEYMKHVMATVFEGNESVETPVVEGVLVEKLAPSDAIDVCGRYFRSKLLRAEQFRHRKAEEALLQSVANGSMMSAVPAYA